MAGLLTFPQSALPSQPYPRPVTFSKQTLCFEGITAAGTVPDSHRIPLHRNGPKPPDYHICAAKVLLFSTTTNQSAKIFQNKKEKGTETHRKTSEFQRLNWKRDPAGIRTRDPQLRSLLYNHFLSLLYNKLYYTSCTLALVLAFSLFGASGAASEEPVRDAAGRFLVPAYRYEHHAFLTGRISVGSSAYRTFQCHYCEAAFLLEDPLECLM